MKPWTSKICRTSELKIHYLRTGGTKPPLILLHGLLVNARCWIPFAKELENDYDVIIPDARGDGSSSTPNQEYQYEVLAKDLLNFMQMLKISDPILAGHSMGGMTALIFASQYPNQIKKLILIDLPFLTKQQQEEVYASDLINQHCQILKRAKKDFLAEIKSNAVIDQRNLLKTGFTQGIKPI